MSIFGKISHHLIAARETALAHDSNSTWERLAIDTLVMQIDVIVLAARKLHQAVHLNRD